MVPTLVSGYLRARSMASAFRRDCTRSGSRPSRRRPTIANRRSPRPVSASPRGTQTSKIRSRWRPRKPGGATARTTYSCPSSEIGWPMMAGSLPSAAHKSSLITAGGCSPSQGIDQSPSRGRSPRRSQEPALTAATRRTSALPPLRTCATSRSSNAAAPCSPVPAVTIERKSAYDESPYVAPVIWLV